MPCSRVRARLFPYLDGELPPEDRAEIEAHVGECAGCQHAVEVERAFREIYVLPLRPDPVPAAVRDRAEHVLARLGVPRPAWRRGLGGRRRALAASAFAGVLLLVGAWGGFLAWVGRDPSASLLQLAEASVDQHLKLTRGVLPLDVTGVSPGQAEEWFRRKMDFNVRLPELKDDQLTLLGGRISHLRAYEVAALQYRLDEANVTLFVIPTDLYRKLGLAPEPRFKMVNQNGYDVIVWTAHGGAYALVSEIGGRSCLVCHSRDERLDVQLTPEVHRAR